MNRKLPSLSALRAFEAASRFGNFTKASEELLLTPSAISRHISNLEADLATSLFTRKGRQVTLTEDGLRLKGIVGQAFDVLSDGIEAMRDQNSRPSLTVSLLPSLAAKWLVPWIGAFSAQHPEIDLNIHCSRALVDFERDGIDVAIRYGRGTWAGCVSELIMREELVVVCAPSVVRDLGANPDPGVLAGVPVLYGDEPDTWQTWLRVAGVPDLKLPKGPVFTDANALLEAAIAGQGIMLGRSVLVAGDLAMGQLSEPFALRVPASYAYYLVTSDTRSEDAVLANFKSFIADITRG